MRRTLTALMLAALAPIAFADETALTIYSTATPGAIPPEWYRPTPGQSYNGYNPYQQQIPGYAVIKQERSIEIAAGRSEIQFTDVAAFIDPTTVSFKSLTDPEHTRVLEQDYRYDLIDLSKMLQRHVGNDVKVNGQMVTLLSVNPAGMLVKDATKEIFFVNGFTNVRMSEAMAEGLITVPTLAWDVVSETGGEQETRVTYQTTGITWWADYNLTFTPGKNANSGTLDVGAWVSILNQSGAGYEDAKLKLIAGDVQRAPQGGQGGYKLGRQELRMMEADASRGFEEKSFFEYHLYTLGRPITIAQNSTKQTELFEPAVGVPADKILVYYGNPQAAYWSNAGAVNTTRDLGYQTNTKVDVYLRFKNTKKNGLGIPLPSGRIRVSQLDTADGSLEFIGEDVIDHTPKDETILIKLGSAFDVVGERKQTDFRVDSKARWMEESFEIQLRNRKDERVDVLVKETMFRWAQWTIKQCTDDYEKVDARNIHIPVTLEPGEERTITYTVRYTW